MDLGGALTFARQSRAAGGALSNRFLMTTAPGLARDLGDPQLGTALASALSQNIGGRATKQSKAAQQEYGLRDKDGKFLNSDLAIRDPDKWAWDVLMPALKKRGVDVNDNVGVAEANSKLFSNRMVGDVFTKLITQREQYQAKAGQYDKAPGLSAAGALPGKDPFVAYEAVFAQLRNLATQAPIMDSAAHGLTQLSGSIAAVPYAGGSGFDGTYKPAEGYRTPGAVRLGGGRWMAAPQFPTPEVSATTTYGTGIGGGDKTVQAQLTGSARVEGEAKLNVQVNAGSALLSVVERAEAAIRLAGQYTANGVGSTGKSSPDAAAPAAPHVGSAGNSPM